MIHLNDTFKPINLKLKWLTNVSSFHFDFKMVFFLTLTFTYLWILACRLAEWISFLLTAVTATFAFETQPELP